MMALYNAVRIHRAFYKTRLTWVQTKEMPNQKSGHSRLIVVTGDTGRSWKSMSLLAQSSKEQLRTNIKVLEDDLSNAIN